MALSDSIDETKPVQGSPTTQSVRDNFAAAKSAIAQLELTAGVGPRGYSIRAYNTAANMTNISAIAGMIVGDYVVNTGTATRTILGVSTVVGGMVQSTSATAGVAAGNAPTGAPGAAATVTVGTVTTGAPAAPATVTNSGTTAAAILNFTIPQGQTGTGGSGITEQQAIDAVRTAAPVFREQNVTTAAALPATLPNVATTAPTLLANWTLTSGSGATGTYTKTASNTNILAYSVPIVASVLTQLDWTVTNTAGSFSVVLRVNSATDTVNQFYPTRAVRFMPPRNYNYLVIVPNSTATAGTFTLVNAGQSTSAQNSVTLTLKDWVVRSRDGSAPQLFIGGGGAFASGSANMALGHEALLWLQGGGQNMALGHNSLRALTSGYGNLAVGPHSGYELTTGGYNTLVSGYSYGATGTGNNNTSLGFGAMGYNSGGAEYSDNTGIGFFALYALGASQSTAVGSHCLSWNYADRNTGVGYYVLHNVNTGADNTAVGYEAFAHLSSTSGGVAVGARAGLYLANGSTVQYSAADSIFIGRNSRGGATDGATNQIVIGASATGGGSNTITLGNGQITALRCQVTSISALSDARVKEDIQPADLDRCLDTVKNLGVHRWGWAEIAGLKHDKHVTGFLADEIEKIFPKAVSKSDEFLTRYGADGKPLKKMVNAQEPVPDVPTLHEGEGDPSQWKHRDQKPLMRRVQIEVDDSVEIKDLCRVDPTELLPTLWGAVQQLIKKIEELESQQQQPPAAPPAPAAAPPAPAPRRR